MEKTPVVKADPWKCGLCQVVSRGPRSHVVPLILADVEVVSMALFLDEF